MCSLSQRIPIAAEIGVEQGTSYIGEGSEKEVPMAGILVSMSVAMSWSGFVALVHDYRELQGPSQSHSDLRRPHSM